jgi:hypothetical protein
MVITLFLIVQVEVSILWKSKFSNSIYSSLNLLCTSLDVSRNVIEMVLHNILQLCNDS